MFGKYKKQIEELTVRNKKLNEMNVSLETKNREIRSRNAKLEAANEELNNALIEKHKELTDTIKTLKNFKEAFEGSLAGINSLLEDEACYHKRQTEYMRGLKAAKGALEVYIDAK